jgi:hypothetical protein
MCSETGTGWPNLCEDAETLAETWRNRVSLANLSEDAQTLTETRFLSLRRYGIRNRARSLLQQNHSISFCCWVFFYSRVDSVFFRLLFATLSQPSEFSKIHPGRKISTTTGN